MQKIDGLEIYSFYRYSSISEFIKLKYYPQGYRVLKEFAKITFKEFIKNFDKKDIYVIGIDEKIKNGYSHIAVMTHQMNIKGVKVLHRSLLAQNKIQYAGKSREFRKNNPREFKYYGKKDISVILIDDIVTTGTTLLEAERTLKVYGVKVEFALVLADA
jgi:competence protein ComFC